MKLVNKTQKMQMPKEHTIKGSTVLTMTGLTNFTLNAMGEALASLWKRSDMMHLCGRKPQLLDSTKPGWSRGGEQDGSERTIRYSSFPNYHSKAMAPAFRKEADSSTHEICMVRKFQYKRCPHGALPEFI